MMLHICIKFHEKGFRVIEGLPYTGFLKGHNSVKKCREIMVLVLCISSDDALYNFV